MLTDLITGIHTGTHGIYGGRRIHAGLTLGRGVVVGHGQVELLMRRAGLQGLAGRRWWKRIRPDDIATALTWSSVRSPPSRPDHWWVADFVCFEALFDRVGVDCLHGCAVVVAQ